MIDDSPLMNMREVALYLRYTPTDGKRYRGQDLALAFLKRRGVPLEHRGKIVLVRRAALDAALRGDALETKGGRHG